jgi:hypothetical protein
MKQYWSTIYKTSTHTSANASFSFYVIAETFEQALLIAQRRGLGEIFIDSAPVTEISIMRNNILTVDQVVDPVKRAREELPSSLFCKGDYLGAIHGATFLCWVHQHLKIVRRKPNPMLQDFLADGGLLHELVHVVHLGDADSPARRKAVLHNLKTIEREIGGLS